MASEILKLNACLTIQREELNVGKRPGFDPRHQGRNHEPQGDSQENETSHDAYDTGISKIFKWRRLSIKLETGNTRVSRACFACEKSHTPPLMLYTPPMSWELHNVAIMGGGMMGRSIAATVAQEGLNVCMKEVSMEAAEESRAELERALDHEIARFGITQADKKIILSRIRWVTKYDCASDCDLAIEAIQEDFDLKSQILIELDRRMPRENPIVINTSTLSITELAAKTTQPERILGMHFLYPVSTTRVVEVVRGQVTSDDALEKAINFARLLGKVPIKVFEMPGFVATRVILPLVNEAMHVVMEGVAEAAEVDLALKLGYDFRTGPLEWADRVGLDRVLNWMRHMHQESGEPRFRPCPLLKRLVRAGQVGAKAGQGFFTYDVNRRRLDRLEDDKPGLA